MDPVTPLLTEGELSAWAIIEMPPPIITLCLKDISQGYIDSVVTKDKKGSCLFFIWILFMWLYHTPFDESSKGSQAYTNSAHSYLPGELPGGLPCSAEVWFHLQGLSWSLPPRLPAAELNLLATHNSSSFAHTPMYVTFFTATVYLSSGPEARKHGLFLFKSIMASSRLATGKVFDIDLLNIWKGERMN